MLGANTATRPLSSHTHTQKRHKLNIPKLNYLQHQQTVCVHVWHVCYRYRHSNRLISTYLSACRRVFLVLRAPLDHLEKKYVTLFPAVRINEHSQSCIAISY